MLDTRSRPHTPEETGRNTTPLSLEISGEGCARGKTPRQKPYDTTLFVVALRLADQQFFGQDARILANALLDLIGHLRVRLKESA